MGDTWSELERLEHQGWQSLCDGTGADFYGSLMTEDGLMVLVNGVAMDRETVLSSLREAPRWSSYELDDLRHVQVGPRGAALVYRGSAHRPDGTSFTALMTSVYVEVSDAWRLALYTQTLAE